MAQDISLKNKNRGYIRSSSFVMAMIFTVLCGSVVGALGYFINYFATGHFIHSTETVLNAEIRYIEATGAKEVKTDERLYLFLEDDNTLPEGIPSKISRLSEGILLFNYSENNQYYAAKIHTLDDNRKILIATNITKISKDFQFMQWLGIASIGFVIAVVFVSYLISIFVVSGTNKIAKTAREIIDTGDLSRRIDVGSNWDDLGSMAGVLNLLLDRIEELMCGVRNVSDNIAHDLRTPLTRLRHKIESSESANKEELLNEADHLLNTFNALLRISRIESGKQRDQFKDSDLKEILEDVIALYDPVAEEKSIQLTYNLEPVSFYGDRDLLFQAYSNLMDNALKYTPKNGHVTVNLKRGVKNIIIGISDTGIGIDKSEKTKIFDRFYRGEKSRSSKGIGLGLSLVQAIIMLHNGHIDVENENPGLKIITIF